MAKIIVLGAGLVGGVMAKDLSKKHKITSCFMREKLILLDHIFL